LEGEWKKSFAALINFFFLFCLRKFSHRAPCTMHAYPINSALDREYPSLLLLTWKFF